MKWRSFSRYQLQSIASKQLHLASLIQQTLVGVLIVYNV